MQRMRLVPRSIVQQIVCDLCGKEAERDTHEFAGMKSIAFHAGYSPSFGSGHG